MWKLFLDTMQTPQGVFNFFIFSALVFKYFWDFKREKHKFIHEKQFEIEITFYKDVIKLISEIKKELNENNTALKNGLWKSTLNDWEKIVDKFNDFHYLILENNCFINDNIELILSNYENSLRDFLGNFQILCLKEYHDKLSDKSKILLSKKLDDRKNNYKMLIELDMQDELIKILEAFNKIDNIILKLTEFENDLKLSIKKRLNVK